MILKKSRKLLSVGTKSIPKEYVTRSFHKTVRLDKCLTRATINPNFKNIEFGITGTLFQRAATIENELLKGVQKPFKNVTRVNIGDVQALGQPPITFLRQVLALASYTELLNSARYPEDVKKRVRDLLKQCVGGSIGSYSDGCGMEFIRRRIAKFIEERDNVSTHWTRCLMSHGACDMAKKFFPLLCIEMNGKKSGVLCPIPGYPVYSAQLAENDLERINYYLEQDHCDNSWNINTNELQRAIDLAKSKCNPRAIIVINPGNPTGNILTRKNMEEIIRFAYRENLIIVADEVHQNDILKSDLNFVSFNRVLHELDELYNQLELFSLMSLSNGIFGECGAKIGYGHLVNMDPEIVPMFVKSINALLPSVLSQIAMYVFVNPPNTSEPSYEQYLQETESILSNLRTCASILEETFNNMEGIICNRLEGGLSAYPKLRLPKGSINVAKKAELPPDEFYALELLEHTGICVTPGNAFNDRKEEHHICMTILPKPDELHKLMKRYRTFHMNFLKKYSDCSI